MNDEIILRALDGSNPLAFLAALGTFRLLVLASPGGDAQMNWERQDDFWRPKLRGFHATEEELCNTLAECRCWAPAEDFMESLDDSRNITVSKETFKPFVRKAFETALQDRRTADFVAAFGCEVCEEENNDRIERTDFCFITGSGHQDFLGTMAGLQKSTTRDHLYDALFGEWRAEKGLSMRWDPSDAAEYALQWDNPGPKGAWAVWGANRLAVEALPLFPTAPTKDGLETVGFTRRNRRDELTWPIWEHRIGLASVRSLLSLAELQKDPEAKKNPFQRETLLAMGIKEVYRAQRIRIGQGANFKVSFRPARSV